MSDRYDPEEAQRNTEAVRGHGPGMDPATATCGDFQADNAPSGADDPAPAGDLPVLDIHADWGTPPPRRRWLVQNYLPLGHPALFVGEGGSGKTKAALQLAHNMATARPGESRVWFDGGPAILEPGPVVFATWEDERDEVHRRLLTNPAYEFGDGSASLKADLAGNLQAVNLMGYGPLWEPGPHGGLGKPTDYGLALQRHCEGAGARLLIVDALDSAYADDENVRPRVRAFVSHWQAWGLRTGCTPLFIAHPAKGEGSTYSGSTAWRNAFRVLLTFTGDGDDRAELAVDKINYGRKPGPVTLTNWKWWHADTTPPEERVDRANEKLETAIIRLLTKHHPTKLSKNKVEAAITGHSTPRKRAALDRMELDGRIEAEPGKRGATLYGLPSGDDLAP